MEPCWRGFLLHNVLLGALQGITHYVDGVHDAVRFSGRVGDDERRCECRLEE